MFYGLLEEILKESVASVDEITAVMDDHAKILVTYKPVTQGREHATGTRLIGVFAYGQTKAGNDCIRVFEYAGDTATFVPGWKLLRLDQLLSWKRTGQFFNEPPDKKFNSEGDKSMSVVFKVTQFDDDEVATNDQDRGPKTSENLFLTDTEKKLKKQGERIKNQMNNPIYISDFKARKGAEDYKKGEEEYTEGPKTSENIETEPSNYKDEVAKMFAPLKDKLKNAPKIDLSQAGKPNTPEPAQKETEKEEEPDNTPDYKKEVSQRFEKLRDKIKNAPKIDLSQFEKKKKLNEEIKALRKKLGNTSKPMTLQELRRRLKQ